MLCKLFKHYFIHFRRVYLCVLTLELQSTRKIYCLNDGNLMPQCKCVRKVCQIPQSGTSEGVSDESVKVRPACAL